MSLRRALIGSAVALALVSVVAPRAGATITNAGGDNVQDGNNTAISHQSGGADSGDAIAGGQIVGIAVGAGGRATVDATNTASNASAVSGDVRGSNDMAVFVGLESVLGRQTVRGISSQVRSVGAGSNQSVLTADELIGPDGPVGPGFGAVAPRGGAIDAGGGPVGPPGPVGPAVNDLSPDSAASTATDAQPTGPPGPVGPGFAG